MTVEEAYKEILKRGWGFSRSIGGIVVVGPYKGHIVEAWGADVDPVRAVEKAIEIGERRTQAPDPEAQR